MLHELEDEAVGARNIRIKRIYDGFTPSDGFRVLVDRLWPRGLRKEQAAVDLWARELAPSTELRKWFGHEPKRWQEFRRRYLAELREHADQVDDLWRQAARRRVTLLYGAKDRQFNQAVVLKEFLLSLPRL
jgi:uncharacterized protein YeaO (DUF488 family)